MALTEIPIELSSTPSIVDGGNATAITIDSSENVGIGTGSPATQLFVKSASNAANVFAIESANAAQRLQIGVNTSNGGSYIFEQKAQALRFGTSDTERMIIDSSGLVGISNSIPSSFSAAANNLVVGSGSGQEGITIYGGSESNIFFADGTDAASYIGRIEYSHGTDSLLFYANNTFLMKLSTSGYFVPQIRSSSAAANDVRFNTSNGEIYYQTSSERYKSNIVDLEFDTSNLYNLRPVSFDDNETGERCFGLIAEETFDQIPEAVVTRNIDGETVPDSIPYSMLSVLIINEMKNLKTENDSLRSRIEALENN